MASIQKRTRNGKTTYRVQYRDPAGRMRGRVFARKVDAERFRTENEHAKNRGAWVDPAAGKVTLRSYATPWLAAQTSDPLTREGIESRVRLHVLPTLGDYPLAAILPSTVKAWVRGLQATLGPASVKVVHASLSAILSSAVEDGLLAKSPASAASARPPSVPQTKLVPWTAEQVTAVTAALPERLQATVAAAAGLGLRQGEVFGLAVEDCDFHRKVVHVRRQVRIVGNTLVFSPPKTGKSRDVPLPSSVALALAAHLVRFPARTVRLAWREPSGRATRAVLLSRAR